MSQRAAPQLSLVHRARLPDVPDAANGRHPAVIALHGRGSDEADLISLAPYLDDRLLWLSPRAPLALEGGYEWYRLPQVGVPDQPSFEAALGALDRFVNEALQAYPIDPARLVFFGFSQGSMMSFSYALTHPGRVKAIAAHSGYVPRPAVQAAGPVDPAAVRGLPILILHGTRDRMIPVRWAREARDFLTQAGAQVEYYEFATAHNVTDRSLATLEGWLQRQLFPEETRP